MNIKIKKISYLQSNVSTESDYQEAGAAAATAIAPAAPSLTTSAVVAHPDASMCITQPDAGGICLPPSSVLIQGPDARPNIQYKLGNNQIRYLCTL